MRDRFTFAYRKCARRCDIIKSRTVTVKHYCAARAHRGFFKRKITSLSDIGRAFPYGNYYYGKIDIESTLALPAGNESYFMRHDVDVFIRMFERTFQACFISESFARSFSIVRLRKKEMSTSQEECDLLPDDNGRDRNQRNDRAHFNGNPADWLHMGSESAARIERLQSQRLSILQQHTGGYWLQVRRLARRFLRQRAAQMSGNLNLMIILVEIIIRGKRVCLSRRKIKDAQL